MSLFMLTKLKFSMKIQSMQDGLLSEFLRTENAMFVHFLSQLHNVCAAATDIGLDAYDMFCRKSMLRGN